MADEALRHEKITVLTNTVMEAVSGRDGLTYARYRNTKTGEVTQYHSPEGEHFGVFVLAGYAPATAFLKGFVERNSQGHIVTDGSLKTNVDGVYAAGDVCVKPLRQVVTATADGALAANELEKYVAAMQQKTGLRGAVPPAGQDHGHQERQVHSADGLFTKELIWQLKPVFDRMERKLILKLYLDNRPVSKELETFIGDLTGLSGHLSMLVISRNISETVAPYVQICREDGTKTGLAFHGVPSGHEFTSFILGIYNAAGPGQALDYDLINRIRAIQTPVDIKILVTLSCTMCPETVTAAQKIAAGNPNVTAEAYDISHFEDLRKQYRVMSVPCLVINDTVVSFGKKRVDQILDLIEGSK